MDTSLYQIVLCYRVHIVKIVDIFYESIFFIIFTLSLLAETGWDNAWRTFRTANQILELTASAMGVSSL